MTFTKKKLAAAIGGTLLASVGMQQAQATVDIDDTAGAGALEYATEIVVGTQVTLADSTNVQDVVGLMATNGIQDNTDIRITLTLSSGTFAATPSVLIVDSSGADSGCAASAGAVAAACPVPTLFSGGTTADSTVTYNSSNSGNVTNALAHFLWDIPGLLVTDQSTITATVTTQIADSFGPTDLPTNSGTLLTFGPLLSLAADATSGDAGVSIDVAQNSLYFNTAGGTTGDVSYNVGGAVLGIANTASTTLGVGSTAIDASHVTTSATHTITAANGFAAFNQGTAGAATGISVGGATAGVSTADATVVTQASAAYGSTAGDNAGSRDVILSVPTANTVAIDETTVTATVAAATAGATYSNTTSSGTVNLLSLSRNGTSARLTFSVNPDSPYPMSIRVTNDSAIDGPVTLTLTNDDGDTSASVSISDIAGGPTGDLAAGGSTGLLQMSDVFAAVQAADATFDLGASSNKLRVSVSALTPSIVLNAFSLSSDGTTFSMVTDAGA